MLARHEVCREKVMTGVVIGIEIKLKKNEESFIT